MKEKAGKALLSFFILMLCCTLVARGADSITVPKVQTASFKSGNLTHSFSGNGTLKARSRTLQFLPEGQKILKLLAKPGNPVEAGQALVQLDLDYLEEQIRDQERKIQKLQLQMEQQKLNGQTAARLPATAQAELSLDDARKARNDAREAYQQAEAAYQEYLESSAHTENTAHAGNAAGSTSEENVAKQTVGENGTPASGKDDAPPAADSPDKDDAPPADASSDKNDTPPNSNFTSADSETEQKKQELLNQMDAARQQYEAAQDVYEKAKDSYRLAEQEEANTQANEAVQRQSSQLTLKGMALDLEELQEDLDKLTAIREDEGIITAVTSGILEASDISEGALTTGTEALILSSKELEACGQIPDQEIGRIWEKDEVEVRLLGAAKSVFLPVERLESDEEGNLYWYAACTGTDLRKGTPFSYAFSQKTSASYEQLIPLSALYESGGSTYVLTAELRSGILGDSYTAVKVPVTLLEKDSQYAAVQTSLSRDALIIMGSSKYVKEGDRVRLNN